MSRSSIVTSMLSRVLEVLADFRGGDINVTLSGSTLTLKADLGNGAASPRRPVQRDPISATGVAPNAIVDALTRRPMNLADIARAVGEPRKMALKGIVASLVGEGRIERAAGGVFRVPGTVRRPGRPPGSGRKVAKAKASRPAVTPKPVKKANRPAKKRPTPVPAKPKATVPKRAAKKLPKPAITRPKPASSPVPKVPAAPEANVVNIADTADVRTVEA